jgi:hypothetical protein
VKPYTEVGGLVDGTVVYRMRCEKCSPQKVGVWLKSVDQVERSIEIHERIVHPVQAVA